MCSVTNQLNGSIVRNSDVERGALMLYLADRLCAGMEYDVAVKLANRCRVQYKMGRTVPWYATDPTATYDTEIPSPFK